MSRPTGLSHENREPGIVPNSIKTAQKSIESSKQLEQLQSERRYARFMEILLQADIKVFEELSKKTNA